jgi:hypothetical protein
LTLVKNWFIIYNEFDVKNHFLTFYFEEAKRDCPRSFKDSDKDLAGLPAGASA